MQIFKPHPNVAVRATISVNLSADQWGLDTDKWPRVIIEKVADFLNKRFTMEYNKGEGIDTLRSDYNNLRESFVLYVTDETDQVFEKLINQVFPDFQG